jgi:superfamily II DNA or RNA helicase
MAQSGTHPPGTARPATPQPPRQPEPARSAAALPNWLTAGIDIEPRDYQHRVVSRVIEMFSGPHLQRGQELPAARSVIVESPTGSGKTAMALLVARWAQEHLGMRVVWTAMRRNLLAQAERENRQRGFGVDLAVVSMFDRAPPRGDLLIVDEAQHDATRSMASLHAAVGPVHVLGLSATPYRTDRLGLCFERVVRDSGIRQLVLDGHLSPYAHYTIANYTPDSVATTWLAEPDRWGRSLIFFRTLAECRACAARLEAAGVPCEVVTATTDRERQIARFEAGDCPVILSMAVLTEGFDCPALQSVFCRPSGRGPTVQMAGRVLRRAAGVPLKNVVQCAQTRHPFTATAPAAVQYVAADEGGAPGAAIGTARAGDRWRSIGMNGRIEALSERMLKLLVAMSRGRTPTAGGDEAAGGPLPVARRLRRMRRWDFRAAEAHERLRRRNGNIPGRT